MYHTNKKKQALITSFSHKNIHTDNYIGNTDQYMVSLSPKKRAIANVYIRYDRYYSSVQLTNEQVAKEAGCSVITVIRATNQFHEDGFITKHQQNKYAPNYFTFNVREQSQDMFISPRIIIDHRNKTISSYRNDRQNKSLLLDINLFINLSPNAHAREREKRVFKKTYNSERRIVMKQKPEPKKQGIYAPWKAPEKRSDEDQKIYLREQIKLYEMRLANPKKYFAYSLEALVKINEKALVESLEELIELERRSNEKQSILHQSKSDIMATCSA
jgi:Fe2+ or Zn2+ uptake regulation protein